MSMTKAPAEWLKQAKYDMDPADAMLMSRRYIYAVFMCHLSIERAFKSLYLAKLQQVPPKTHNLPLLLGRVGAVPPGKMNAFITELNEAAVVTRYPENLAALTKKAIAPRRSSVTFAKERKSLNGQRRCSEDRSTLHRSAMPETT